MEFEQNDDFYQSLRKRILDWANSQEGKTSQWTQYVLAVPDVFHLLVKLTLDPEVPAVAKAKLGVGLAYFISPIDLLPEALLGPLGFTDDIVVAAIILKALINETDAELVRKHWAGEEDILKLVQHIIDVADRMVGTGLLNKIKKMF